MAEENSASASATAATGLAATAPAAVQQGVLDPFTCIPKRNQKYAKECTEVYLGGQDAEELSENFCRFPNLEVAWFNKNRLTRLENLETNFRIREVFVQDNKLVSLSGLKNCKFLRVLLASNNQLQNLEKQLAVISKFPFLKKLELSGNPIANEPEYRLRIIHHEPQVDLLDCAAVRGPERLRAAEVVPNLDKVFGPPPKRERAKKQLSTIERDVFRETRQIREQEKQREEDAITKMFASTGPRPPLGDTPLQNTQCKANAQAWSTPRELLLREQSGPTPWEMREMLQEVEKRCLGKKDMTQADVCTLCDTLARDGLEDLGRSLKRSEMLDAVVPPLKVDVGSRAGSKSRPGSKQSKTSSKSSRGISSARGALRGAVLLSATVNTPRKKVDLSQHPLKALQDPAATMPAKDVAKYLLTLDWPRQDEEMLGRRIEKLYADAKSADLAGKAKDKAAYQMVALKLEGAKERMMESKLGAKDDSSLGSARKPRADVFHQCMIRPQRMMDEDTGRRCLHLSVEQKSSSIGG